MSFSCEPYSTPTLVWPLQTFPRTLFPRWSGQRLTAAQKAWTLFEKIESADAAIRVQASASGRMAISWTPFDTESARQTYNYGKWLHQQLCPEVNWVSQRDIGLSLTPLTTIWPVYVCGPINTFISGYCPVRSF